MRLLSKAVHIGIAIAEITLRGRDNLSWKSWNEEEIVIKSNKCVNSYVCTCYRHLLYLPSCNSTLVFVNS